MLTAGFRQQRRRRLWRLTNNRCWYCGTSAPEEDQTVDHVIPRCQGGSDDDDNLVPCCKPCNILKSDLSVAEFRVRVIQAVGLTNYPSSSYAFAFEVHGWRMT